MEASPDIYDGPAGEPFWDKKLPDRVDDYTVPRYVYENLEESTEYIPENKRIIGYRISPTLVIHSRFHESVNASRLTNYLKRYGGKLLEEEELILLRNNIEQISILRQKAKDSPLDEDSCWCSYNGTFAIADFMYGMYWRPANNFYGYPLIMKR